MNPKWTLSLALAALFGLTGCKLDVTATGTLIDLTSGKTEPVELSLYAKNTRRACAVTVTLSDSDGKALYELKSEGVVTNEDGARTVDTSTDDCSKDSKVILQARSMDRVIRQERVEKWTHCSMSPGGGSYPNGEAPKLQKVTVNVETLVSTIEGKILDRATGQVLKTFTATTEPRYEESTVGNGSFCR